MVQICVPFVIQAGMPMELVPGVSQKPFCKTVPQLSNSLQLPPQPPWSQNETWPVAKRQLVFGASIQVGPLVIVVQDPVQIVPDTILQNVTVTVA